MANQFIYKDTTFGIGDTLNVTIKVVEGEKIRNQVFTGLLIAIKNKGDNKSFTVRKIASHSVGVEKIFPVLSPDIISITLKSKGNVRRSKLYYLRGRKGREALRVKSVKQEKKNAPAKKKAGTTRGTASKKVSKK